jgi:hypothetical protein
MALNKHIFEFLELGVLKMSAQTAAAAPGPAVSHYKQSEKQVSFWFFWFFWFFVFPLLFVSDPNVFIRLTFVDPTLLLPEVIARFCCFFFSQQKTNLCSCE